MKFNEQTLLQEIVNRWGAYGSHAEVCRELIKLAALTSSTPLEQGDAIKQEAAAQNYAVDKTHPFNKLFTKLTDAFIAGVEWHKQNL